jgi:dTDP-4-dehydrorhamnose 3,5-epimerase
VAVDIRKDSLTYGEWQGVELKEGDGQALYVPEGFAHGFVVLSETARVLYKTTAEYAPELERGIVWNDPDLKIEWPVENPVLAPRDAAFPKFKDLQH